VLQESLEHDLDVFGFPEHALELRPAASRADDGEVAGPRVAQALAVDHERHAGNEVRLADDELAALLDLDDCPVGQLGAPASGSADVLVRENQAMQGRRERS
jgi:hypothetical protein